MNLIVQTDDGLAKNANAYVEAIDVINYWSARGVVIVDDEKTQAAIVTATDYLDQRFTFVGKRINGRNQRTQWPRNNVVDIEGYTVVGVPSEVKEVVCEYVKRILVDNVNLMPDNDASTAPILSKTETVGPITESVTYANAGAKDLPSYPAADNRLKIAGFIKGNAVGNTVGNLLRG